MPLSDQSSAAKLPAWPYPAWIAHRGAGTFAPENTLAAFKVGVNHGFTMFECDARLGVDGTIFLSHDEQLGRTISGCGNVLDLPWKALSQMDAGSWHSATFAGEPVPTLTTIWDFCATAKCCLNIEIKTSTSNGHQTGAAVSDAAHHLSLASPLPELPLLSSFDQKALEGAREAAPDLPRALLLNQLTTDWVKSAQDLQCRAVVIHYPLINQSVVEMAQHHQLHVLSYTPNTADEWIRLTKLGVKGLITDRMDRDPALIS